ncbi:unnamed protein product [Scytosiphon promiscuus]
MHRLIPLLLFATLGITVVHGFLLSPALRSRNAARQRAARALAAAHGEQGDMQHVLFVEIGFGNDQHGQNATKACVRACRNAIEFNSIPSIKNIVPGGYAGMKLRVQLAVPVPEEDVDVEEIKKVFPYGVLLPIEFQAGGMRASSGIALPEMGDKNDDMIIVISCVTVGY